jgi:hypothetical protein
MIHPKLFGHASARNARKMPNIQQLGDPGSSLIETEIQTWTGMKQQERFEFLESLDASYHRFVDEFYQLANDCVDRYDSASSQHASWRRGIIVGTGIIAIINLLAANPAYSLWSKNILPISAAAAALVLTVLANLESFYNFSGRAQAYRESRELFLDAARESQRVWEVYVQPFGSEAHACANGIELYRRVVAIDRDLRSKFKELTKTKEDGKGAGSHGK